MADSKLDSTGILMLSLLTPVLLLQPSSTFSSSAPTKRFTFNVEWKNVNGKYPGPTIVVHEGDNVESQVNNRIATNTTLHWHGIRQMRIGWEDGPAYVTQCPIAAGKSYTYRFIVNGHSSTLWWHSHVFWQRASVYGGLVIYPRMPYPFSAPVHADVPIIFGEWWNEDVDEVENEMIMHGGGPNVSDAYTINGLPGPKK